MIPSRAISPAATRVLLAVIDCPAPRTITAVADTAGLPRSRTYDALVSLRRDGLVDWDQDRSGTLRATVGVVG